MIRDDVLARLRRHEAELRDAGVAGLALFGSVARGEATVASDVDVVVTLAPRLRASGFGYFGAIEDLVRRLSQILERRVDVVPEPVRRASLAAAIERDRFVAF